MARPKSYEHEVSDTSMYGVRYMALFLAQELQLYVFVVISLPLEQLVMRSLFCDFPIFDEVTAQIGSSQSWKRHV